MKYLRRVLRPSPVDPLRVRYGVPLTAPDVRTIAILPHEIEVASVEHLGGCVFRVPSDPATAAMYAHSFCIEKGFFE